MRLSACTNTGSDPGLAVHDAQASRTMPLVARLRPTRPGVR